MPRLDLSKYITGKRIAVIGNAQSIFKHQFGEEIDGHDCVVRFSKGVIINESCQGSKTDIVCLSCKIDRNIFGKDKLYLSRLHPYREKGEHLIGNHMEMRKYLKGVWPSTGFMFIMKALEFNPKAINLYGFDGGKTKTFYNRPEYISSHDFEKEAIHLKKLEKVKFHGY